MTEDGKRNHSGCTKLIDFEPGKKRVGEKEGKKTDLMALWPT